MDTESELINVEVIQIAMDMGSGALRWNVFWK